MMYQVIAKLKNHNPIVEGTEIRVEPYWIAKMYKSLNVAKQFVESQRTNARFYFEINEVA